MLVATRFRRRGPLGVAMAALAAMARGAPYIFSIRHVLGLVTACILFMGMLQMMSGAGGPRPAAAANTTVGNVRACSSAVMGAGRHATGSGSSATSPQPTPTSVFWIHA